MESFLVILSSIQPFIDSHLTAAVVATIAIVFETILRFVKTDKPASILYMVEKILKALGSAFGSIASFIDSILPQRVKL